LKPSIKFETDALDPSLPFVFDLPLPRGLLLVDSREGLEELGCSLTNATLIGIDTETKPADYRNEVKRKTSLLQICTRCASGDERVFVIDLLYLSKHDLMETLNKCLINPMENASVTKIGHGLEQDFDELFVSYPVLTALRKVRSVVETNSIHKLLHPNEKRLISLKTLTKQYLHLNLVKAQTCSDWERRPLSDAQLHYSACDCLVLLRLYDVMMYECIDVLGKFDFTDIMHSVVLSVDEIKDSTDVSLMPVSKFSRKSNEAFRQQKSGECVSLETSLNEN
jgi:hypothetical protein